MSIGICCKRPRLGAQGGGWTAWAEFRKAVRECIAFPHDSFDVTISMTVIEEVDAQQMLAEMYE
jgi:ubiquinone/menaquinone biosynthesis C-methylase UbiE